MTRIRQTLKQLACVLSFFAVSSCSDAAVAPAPVPAYMKAVSGPVQSGSLGKRVEVTVDVRSIDSIPVAGVPVTFSASGGATVPSTAVITDASGHASVVVTLADSAGMYPVSASTINGVSTTILIYVRVIVPAAVAIVSGTGQSGPINSTLPVPLVARVFANLGEAAAGATVQWTVMSGSATLNPSTAVTNANGEVSTVVTFGSTPGPVTVSASVGSPTASITLTATSP